MRIGVKALAGPLLITVGALSAQQSAPVGIVRGDLVKWQADSGRGSFELRALDTRLLTCSFDPKTYFERDNQRIGPAAMFVGDRLEIVADREPGASTCYARTVHVIDPAVLKRPLSRLRLRESVSSTEFLAPRGDMTFSGVVLRVSGDSLLLRTRAGGEQNLLLRSDTRYMGEGLRVAQSTLQPQTKVFVRAGRNLDGDIEAYSVTWGDIVQAR